ncbi:MAG: phosphoribosylformylglycinamidine synthase subunit PurQ [Flavobacteriales bacterium]|nr:MAG: phosphoribosylformylglycinamidine synthase subunit PurQ [Flavobacteriales bacterium]
MNIGVIVFPGSNCDRDMMYVLETILGHTVVELWHKDADLKNVDMVVLPGGFSYGDYLRSGAIARFSPVMNSVVEFAKNGGWVIGICNGFQVLCEAGLLPGALLHNTSHRFICKNVFIKPANNASAINADLEDKAYQIPIAHGEGRYYIGDDELQKIEDNNQVIFRYCDTTGAITEDSNPNGSLNNIAGVCNEQRNVFGMMPHPERAADKHLGNEDGKEIFLSLFANLGVLKA